MAKTNNPKKPKVLNEVSITATRLAKPKGVTRLYPSGSVSNKSLDSIRSANPKLGKMIGKPISKSGELAQYGTSQSDLIKSALKPKKKK